MTSSVDIMMVSVDASCDTRMSTTVPAQRGTPGLM
jgi:hypothetical protein